MADEEQPPTEESKPLHPLPGFCWMWLVAAIFIAGIGGLIVHSCLYPRPAMLDAIPKGDARWIEIVCIGFAGVFTGLAYGWFWHRFAVRKDLTRRTWHIGTGLMILGGVFLFLTGWQITSMGFLLTLTIWAQGNTRRFFERA